MDEAVIRRAVSRAKAGDEEALRLLYSRYAPVVLRFVTRLLGDRDTAQDVTQNTFLKLLTKLDRYVPGEAPFEAWLLRVARNAARDELRSRRTTVPAEFYERDHAAVDGTESLSTTELLDALATLPHEQRQAVVLRHVVGLPAQEVARRLERSERAVNSLDSRARERLRGSLAGFKELRVTEAQPAPQADSVSAKSGFERVRSSARIQRVLPITG